MELNITRYAHDTDHGTISGSIAELGPDAARYTWRNAQAAAGATELLTTPDELDNARDWLRGFGAWSVEELAAMPDTDIRALILQFISGDIREAQHVCPDDDNPLGIDWAAYQTAAEDGPISGQLFCADDGQLYYYIWN